MSGLVQQAARLVNSHRIFFYTLVSLVSVSAVIINALKNYSNFYSVAIYLSKSSRSVLVLANFGVLLAILCGHIVQRIFFGSLRPNEVERLYDRLWFFITESLLAFTIFRDEFDTPFAFMFGFLLFVKSFHWLASDRIEWMDQRPYPGPPLLFHFRMATLFVILGLTDLSMFLFAIEHTLTAGVGGMVLFASEYGILMASVTNTVSKYLLSSYDLRRAGRRGGENAPPWENKSMYTFYIELVTDFLKLTTYLIFFIIIITFYGLPLNIIRDVYITARSFITRLKALHRYQTATRNMDQRYPNATEEELSTMTDRTCIICREELVYTGTQESHGHDGPNTTPKKLPCGHIFHFHCLRSWLERQQSCPTCRRNVLEVPPAAQQTDAQPLGQPGQPPAAGHQRPNLGARLDPQNPQLQGGNNPLGFIGRYMGLPARPDNQAVNRQILQNINNNNQAQQAGPGGIYINYQVQYQFPRPNDANLQPGQEQQGLPLPPYAGFPGPEGVWQPWPRPGNAGAQTPAEQRADAGSINATDSQPVVPPTTDTAPTSPNTAPGSSLQGQNVITPREAAAQAALSRLGQKSTPEGKAKEDLSSASIQQIQEQPVKSKPLSSSSSSDRNYPPKFIPLTDFRPSTPGALQQSGSANNFIRNSSLPSRTAPTTSQSFYNNVSASMSRLRQQHDHITSSNLPVNLTDEQLANLDTLTRESIDERLRILEGVSASVYRCIDDLMRLRSALPPVNVPSQTRVSGSANVQAPSSSDHGVTPQADGETTAEDKGKGKQKKQEATEPGDGSSDPDLNINASN
ncbi:hypothetical protein CPC08DRAFT_690536 [Agrocybe pediades]|nr:hypothetical protein CPC08DRAFT_690536 [Agrocybe pediades]